MASEPQKESEHATPVMVDSVDSCAADNDISMTASLFYTTGTELESASYLVEYFMSC